MAGQNVLLSKDVMIAAGAIGFNYSVTMGIIFVNKLLFLRTKFPVLTLAASHLAVSALFTRAAMYAGVFKPRDAKMDRMIFAVAALQTLAISLGQASLKLNSMGFFQLTKQLQVPLVASIEFFYLGRRLSVKKVGLLVIMTLGVCMACASDVQFSWLGALMAATGTACTSVEAVLYCRTCSRAWAGRPCSCCTRRCRSPPRAWRSWRCTTTSGFPRRAEELAAAGTCTGLGLVIF